MNAQPIALVTGATSGIGEATAYRLQTRGHVVVGAGRNPAALDRLRSRGVQARALDVTDENAVAQLVQEIHADYGRVDVLVNSAGFPLPSPLEQVALSDVRRLFETSVLRRFTCHRPCYPACALAERAQSSTSAAPAEDSPPRAQARTTSASTASRPSRSPFVPR